MAEPKERGIIFTADSIQKILDGQKTMTRRVAWNLDIHREIRKSQSDAPIKWPGAVHPARESGWVSWYPGGTKDLAEFTLKQYAKGIECPYGRPGERLYVKETWLCSDDYKPEGVFAPGSLHYRATATPADLQWLKEDGFKWKSPTYMPRWASRLLLEITDIRPERLQAITEEDAKA